MTLPGMLAEDAPLRVLGDVGVVPEFFSLPVGEAYSVQSKAKHPGQGAGGGVGEGCNASTWALRAATCVCSAPTGALGVGEAGGVEAQAITTMAQAKQPRHAIQRSTGEYTNDGPLPLDRGQRINGVEAEDGEELACL